MNRRLRLALLLAALAAAGPSAVPSQAFAAARVTVTVAWLRVKPASRPQLEVKQEVPRVHPFGAPATFTALPDCVLPDSPRLHSLFQRPPPPHS